MVSYAELSTIRVLFREPDSLSLWGIPYPMRRDIGQAPRDLLRAGNTKDWIYLGGPGWFASLSEDRVREIKAFLDKWSDYVPDNPCEWAELPAVVDIRPADRPMLAFILRHGPNARRMWTILKRLGMTRIRRGATFPWEPFPSVWIARCRNEITVALACHDDGEWSLHS